MADKEQREAGELAELIRGASKTAELFDPLIDGLNRWVAASVVTFNAAGIVATLNLYDRLDNARTPLLLFATAATTCFLTALAYLVWLHRLSDVLERSGKVVAQDVPIVPSPAIIKEQAERIARNVVPIIAVAVLGALAALLSVLAGFVFIFSIPSKSESDKRRCAMIEREMMRGDPRRDDLPDVFQALACRPQTTIMPRLPGN